MPLYRVDLGCAGGGVEIVGEEWVWEKDKGNKKMEQHMSNFKWTVIWHLGSNSSNPNSRPKMTHYNFARTKNGQIFFHGLKSNFYIFKGMKNIF